MERFRYYEKKFGIDLSNEKQAENDRWNYYNKMVKEFNEGKIVQPSTVQRRQQSWEKASFRRERMYSKSNIKLESQIEETKKIMLLRVMGKHGIYNGKAYDAMIEGIARALGKDVTEVEDRIFPKMQQEKSTYDNIDNYIDTGEVALTEWVEELVDNNEISQTDGDHAIQLFQQV
jgi:xanthine dehydrogenase molybdopterin-binding subunit B